MNTGQTPKRRVRKLAAIALLLAAMLGVAWMSGYPQRWAIRHFVRTQLGADCRYSSLQCFPALSIGSLDLGDLGNLETPALGFEDIRLDYRLSPTPLEPNRLAIRHMRIDLDSQDGSNFDFLWNAVNRSSEGSATERHPFYLPLQIGIDTVGLSVARPKTSLQVDGMRVNALLETPALFAATLQADPLRLTWEDLGNRNQREGPFLFSAKKEGQGYALDWDLDIHDLLASKGDCGVLPSPNGYHFACGKLSAAWQRFPPGRLDHLGGASLAAEIQQDPAPEWKGALALDGGKTAQFTLSNAIPPQSGSLSVDAWTWGQFVSILPPILRPSLESYGGIAALSLELRAEREEQAVSLSGSVRPRFHSDRLQEPTIVFAARCAPPDWRQVQGKSISIDAGPMLRASLSNWQFDAAANCGQGQMNVFLDLMEAAQRLYLPSLYGECTVSAPVKWKDSALRFSPLQFKGEALGYGGLSLPYGIPLTIKGDATIIPGAQTFETGAVEGALGGDTQVTAGRISSGMGGGGSAWQLRIEDAKIRSGLAPFTAMNWLRQAEGTAEFTSKALEFSPGHAAGRLDVAMVAPKAHIRDEWAVFTDLNLNGFAEWADGFGMQAAIEAREALTLGALVHNLRGNARVKDSTVFFDQIQGALFDGALAMDASIGPEGDAWGIQTAGRLERVDLAVFTQEFKPPAVKLTGRASGAFDLKFRNSEIAGLTIHLETLEGCSLNRDAVQRILLSQYTEGMAGGKVTRVIESVLGEAPQRPFDLARIDLALKGDKIAGDAVLESGSLRLSIDINADPQTLQDALLLRQMQRAEIAPGEGENAPLDAGGASALQ